MECSAFAKITALHALYRGFFQAAATERPKLCEAFFWIADELEDQLQADGLLNNSTFSAFQDLKDFADVAFSDPEQWSGRDEIDALIQTLLKRATDAEDRAW